MTAPAIRRTGFLAHELREHPRSARLRGVTTRKTEWLAGFPVVFASLDYRRITTLLVKENQQLGGIDECYPSKSSCCNAIVLTVEI